MKKLRLGFIGADGMADAHLKGMSRPRTFPLVNGPPLKQRVKNRNALFQLE